MQIQLKQAEIEAALRQYISQHGINLTGKTVEITFTSGRKDNGLSAELIIEDALVTTDPKTVAPTQSDTRVTSVTGAQIQMGDPVSETPVIQAKTSLFAPT